MMFDGQPILQRLDAVVFLSLWAVTSLGWGFDGDRFRDPEDGAIDLSSHLLEYSGFLPVPILITEPALGYGLGTAVVYFDESIAAKNENTKTKKHIVPPNITGFGGFKTENGSWGAAAGAFRTWDNDRYRAMGGLGKVDLALDFYGPTGAGRSYQLEGLGLAQQLVTRIGDSNWMLGGRYLYFKASSDFGLSLPEEIRPDSLETAIGRLSLLIDYDSRDNIFTPSRGLFMELELAAARGWLGSDSDFENLYLRAFDYLPLTDKLILGLRGDVRLTSEDTPFFALPFVSLRGIPALRYQDSRAAMVETELRWNFTHRWAAVGFIGAGRAFGQFTDWDAADTVFTRGLGIRYLLARRLGMYTGIDVARGPEDTAIYIQVGSAWR